jgi:hypothetical protein
MKHGLFASVKGSNGNGLAVMKTNPLLATVVLAIVPCASTGFAEAAAASAAVPSSTAPAQPAPAPQPDRVVYAPRLPTVQELTNAAAAGGFAIARIEQTPTQVTVVYKLADGRPDTVAYAALPPPSTGTTAVAVPSPAPKVVVTPAPTVIYTRSPRVVYYDPWYYDSWSYYPPVSVSLGFGYGRYWGGGHYHGHHGGHGFRRH